MPTKRELKEDIEAELTEARALTEELRSRLGLISRDQGDATRKFNLAAEKAKDAERLFEEAVKVCAEVKQNSTFVEEAVNNIKQKEEVVVVATTDLTKSNALFKALEGEANENLTTTKELTAEIDDLHDILLIDDYDDDDILTRKSLKAKFDDLVAEVENKLELTEEERDRLKSENESFELSRKREFDSLRKELKEEILSLLPNAGTAGLAYSYFDAKSRYGVVPNNNTGKGWIPKIVNEIVHFLSNRTSILFNYGLFIAPICLIVYLFYDFIGLSSQYLSGAGNVIANNNSLTVVFLARLFISIPLAYLSWFGMLSIQSSRRLYEEYNHKQRVMELYHGFKNELAAPKYKNIQEDLLNMLLEVVKDKPSLALNKFDEQTRKSIFPDILRKKNTNKES